MMKELDMTCVVRYRVICAVLICTCLVLASPLPAQRKGKPVEKGKPAESGTKAAAPSSAPRQDGITVNAKSAVLMEATSGQILASQNQDEKIAPASFVKVLTLYVVYDMLKNGKINLTDEVYISKKAWETGGSKMFVEL